MNESTKSTKLMQIEHRLTVWAHWYTQLIAGSLGYASLPIDEIIKAGCLVKRTHAKDIPTNETAERVDAALQVLRQDNLALAKALYAFYVLPGLLKDNARQLGLSYSGFKQQVYMGKIWLVAWFTAKGEL